MKRQCFVLALVWLFIFVLLTLPVSAQSVSNLGDFTHQSGKIGTYRALIIAVDAYTDPELKPLTAPVNSAKRLGKVLKDTYGFSVTYLLDDQATQKAMYKTLRTFASTATPDESSLIFFSGYGQTDPVYQYAWWLPVDASPQNMLSFVDINQLSSLIRAMESRHVLVISDASFTGKFLDGTDVSRPSGGNEEMLRRFNGTSKKVLASCEDVPSGGSGKITALAQALIRQLNGSVSYLSAAAMFKKLAAASGVSKKIVYQGLRRAGANDGELIFVSKKAHTVVSKPKPATPKPAPAPKPAVPVMTRVSITANVAAASVVMDTRDIGTVPIKSLDIEPGIHTVRIQKNGYDLFERTFDIREGNSLPIHAKLVKAQPQTGTLTLLVTPASAAIAFEDDNLRYTEGMALPPGTYRLTVSEKGYEMQHVEVSVQAGSHTHKAYVLSPVPRFETSAGMTFVRIPAGTFTMGSPDDEANRDVDEQPHPVTLSRPFYMQTTEVTVGQWKAFTTATGYKTEAETQGGAWIWIGYRWEKDYDHYWKNPGYSQTDDYPVTCVSYTDVLNFINWLNTSGSRTYALPTEAEWEYACRAGTVTPFNTGDCLPPSRANYESSYKWKDCPSGTYLKVPVAVASYPPNALGLYDMHGNVWEWCADWYGTYDTGPVTDPDGVPTGLERIRRGGGWETYSYQCRSANRAADTPEKRYNNLGFRLITR
ncbi:MAG: hypothetical protein CSA22_07850 [Deltaproteobacteria bacterium]|nr:MAG: hypothetical protein CSA22_07850 [Deltaproteobacteria bacterium]